MDDMVENLRHCQVLSDFADVGLQILSAVVKKKVYANAQSLQVQGEPPKDAGVVFLISGKVRCQVTDSEGKVLGLGTLSAGDHLGGLRLSGETVSPLTAIAEGEVSALVLDRQAFARLQQQKPQTAMKLLFGLSRDFGQRITEAGTLFTDFAMFAANRVNMAERGTYASYESLGMDLTPIVSTGKPPY